jgi:hypothetical protein
LYMSLHHDGSGVSSRPDQPPTTGPQMSRGCRFLPCKCYYLWIGQPAKNHICGRLVSTRVGCPTGNPSCCTFWLVCPR